jgi:competence protein ComEC
MRRSSFVLGLAILVLCVVALGIWYAAMREDRRGLLTVSFLNIGQGDAIFIDAPSGRQVLIDGGKGSTVVRELGQVMPWYDRSLDVVVGTHPDADHIGGLPDVLARYDISTIIRSSVEDSGADQTAFLRAISSEKKAKALIAARGQIVDLGKGAYLEILFPDRPVSSIETNTGSIVARLVYGDTSFMLTGDSPQTIEEYLVSLDGSSLKSDVLKAGHHGSRTSSAVSFVGYVAPAYAVFSRGCGNSYGHPHTEVAELFTRFGIPTRDTCKDGTITFVSDGREVRLK